jgi:tetratricopeptide (TPR) repeat protein
VDDELLALFAEGALTGQEREDVIAHLADCADCRQLASGLLQQPADERAVKPISADETSSWGMPYRPLWLVAASLLVAAGVMFLLPQGRTTFTEADVYRQARGLLVQREFDRVSMLVDEAASQNVRSDRLASLAAQAVRRIPAPLALAHAGRLDDFGVGIGGVTARGSAAGPGLAEAEGILAQTGPADREATLNRGHLLLSRGDVESARKLFQSAVERDAGDFFAWLGLGLAEYLSNDFAAAEASLRRAAAESTPGSLAPRLNLAMTLEELGKADEAIAIWQSLLAQPLSEADRRQIERAIAQLRSEGGVTSP